MMKRPLILGTTLVATVFSACTGSNGGGNNNNNNKGPSPEDGDFRGIEAPELPEVRPPEQMNGYVNREEYIGMMLAGKESSSKYDYYKYKKRVLGDVLENVGQTLDASLWLHLKKTKEFVTAEDCGLLINLATAGIMMSAPKFPKIENSGAPLTESGQTEQCIETDNLDNGRYVIAFECSDASEGNLEGLGAGSQKSIYQVKGMNTGEKWEVRKDEKDRTVIKIDGDVEDITIASREAMYTDNSQESYTYARSSATLVPDNSNENSLQPIMISVFNSVKGGEKLEIEHRMVTWGTDWFSGKAFKTQSTIKSTEKSESVLVVQVQADLKGATIFPDTDFKGTFEITRAPGATTCTVKRLD